MAPETPDVYPDDVKALSADLIRTKLARLASSGWTHRDSWIDIAGFALLVVADIDRSESMASAYDNRLIGNTFR